MSSLTYFASDTPFKEFICPINSNLRASPADREGQAGSFMVTPMEKSEDILTTRQFCAKLTWDGYSDKSANEIAKYLKAHMHNTEELEIWHIWMGSAYPPPKVKRRLLPLSKLSGPLLKEIEHTDLWSNEPITYRGYLPADWGISIDELDPDVHMCYTIVQKKNEKHPNITKKH